MPESWSGYPAGVAFALLFAIAMLRGQATYWIARLATGQALARTAPTGGRSQRLHRWLSGESNAKGRAIIQRFGAWAIPLCYLTVGLQTVVLGSAGVLRLPWRWFTFGQVFGALAWAAIYSTVGLAIWLVILQAPGVAIAVAVAVIGAATVVVLRRRARSLASIDPLPVPAQAS